MAIQEVIKYEGNNDVLIYKHPAEDFNTLSQLIVHESQEAVFFSDGQALDTFKAGRYTLTTKNIPLISKLRNLVSGGVSPFHVEVYFINLATMMDVVWGTPSQVTIKDPEYGYNYGVGANGSFGLKITDGRSLLINMVGTESELSVKSIQKYFKDLIVTRVKNCLALELSKYSYNTINQHLNDISTNISAQIERDIMSFGIKILNFFVSSITINPDDLEILKGLDNNMVKKRYEAMGNREANVINAMSKRDATVIEAEGYAKSRELQGYTWQQEQQFDVSKTFAKNEGFASNPANMMAQIPLAFSMGNMINDNIKQAADSSYQGNEPNNIVCPNCGATVSDNAKFCINCGNKLEIQKQTFCIQCGCQLPVDAKFCMNCGTRRDI